MNGRLSTVNLLVKMQNILFRKTVFQKTYEILEAGNPY
jgi:hypothetical protein